MKQVIQLFLAVVYQAAVGTREATSPLVQCSDYLRCRSDDLEMRWKCIAEQLSVFSDNCRTERHIRSLKALTMRRESDFADCVATITPTVEDNEMQAKGRCPRRFQIPPFPSCDELNNSTINRCEDLQKCCTESQRCEEQRHTTTILSMSAAHISTVRTLLLECRSQIVDTLPFTNDKKSDVITTQMKVQAVTSALRLIEGLEKPQKEVSQETSKPAQENLLSTSVKENSIHTMTAPSWPLATRLEAQIRRSQVKTEYRNRATTMNNRLPIRTFAAPLYSVRDATTLSPRNPRLSPVLILDRQSGNVEGTASMIRDQRLRQLINEGGLYSRDFGSFSPLSPSPTTRSPYQVDLIIDRSFQKFFHPPPIPPIPPEYSTVTEFHERPRSPLLSIPPMPTPLPRHTVPLVNTSPISSTFTPIHMIRKPIHLRKGDSVHRPKIRKPWSTQLMLIKRPRWRGTSKRKQKNYTSGRTAKVVDNEAKIPPRRGGFSNAIRPSSTFHDEFSKYPKNTDILTDIAIPDRNRLKPKTRYKLVPRPRSTVENEADTSHLTHIFISPKKSANNGIENAIYEDILVQERKALSQRNTPLSTDEVDFDDSIDPPQTQELSMTPAPFVLLEQRRKGSGSTGHRNNSEMTPERFYFKWDNTAPKNRAVFTKVVSMHTTPSRITTVSGVVSLPTTTDPLEDALVEEPLTKDEGMRQIVATVKLEEVEEKELEPLVISNETITFRSSTPLTLNVSESVNDSFVTVTSQPNTTLESKFTEPITVTSEHSSRTQSLSDFDTLSDITNSETYRGPHYYYDKNPDNDTIQEEATIIATMRSPYWTSDPPPSGFQIEVIPFPKSNPVDGPLIAVDKAVTIKHTSSAPTETTTTFPTLIESSPEFIGPLPPESEMNRARVMGVKIARSVPEPVDSMINVSAAAHDNTEAVSVLKLSETTVKLSHCEVYSLCLDELSREEKACGAQASRIVTQSQRKQRSSCSKKLLPDYKAVDAETRRLEDSYSACIKNRLGQNIAEVKATQCTAHSLPTSLDNEPCRSKVHVLKQHCSRLAKCCPDAQTCRSELDRSDRARYLRRRKESLALAATKCRIHKYRELFRSRNLLSTDLPLPS